MPEYRGLRGRSPVRFHLEIDGEEVFRMTMGFVPRKDEHIELTPSGGSLTTYKVESVHYIVPEFAGVPDPGEPGDDPADYSPHVRIDLSVVV